MIPTPILIEGWPVIIKDVKIAPSENSEQGVMIEAVWVFDMEHPGAKKISDFDLEQMTTAKEVVGEIVQNFLIRLFATEMDH